MSVFHRTVACLRKARITIPQLSPTHTRAKIVKWCLPTSGTKLAAQHKQEQVEEYDPIMVLQCSADLVTEGFRESDDHEPLMIIDIQEEGLLTIDNEKVELEKWYPVGHVIGEIDDGDDDDDDNDDDWLWQAYSYSDEDTKKE